MDYAEAIIGLEEDVYRAAARASSRGLTEGEIVRELRRIADEGGFAE